MTDDETPLRNMMLKASVTVMLLLIISRSLGYVFHLIFVRWFSREEYGSFIFVFSLGLFVCGLIPHISSSVSRYVAYYRGSGDGRGVESTIWTGMALNALLLLIALVACYIAWAAGILGIDWPSLLFMASVVALTSVSNMFAGVVSGFRRPEVSSTFNMLQNLARLLAVAAAAYLASTVYGVMGLVALSFLASTLLLAAYEVRTFGLGSSYDRALAVKLFSFGAFNVVYTTANNLLAWTSIFLLQYFTGPGQVAVYNVAYLASTVSLLFFLAALQIFSPVVSELFGAGRLERIRHITSYLFESFFLLFLPLSVAVAAFSRELLVFFVKPDYASGALPLQILSLCTFSIGLSTLFTELINAEGRPKVNARNLGAGAVANVILNLTLIPPFGMAGSAAAALASSLLILALSYSHVRVVVGLTYSKARVGKIVFSSLVALAAAYIVKGAVSAPAASLVLSAASLFAVYSLALLALRGLRREDAEIADVLLEKAGAPAAIRRGFAGVLSHGVSG